MAGTPAKPRKDIAPSNQATPQKGSEVMIAPSPDKTALSKSPAAHHTPGQTPIKSPALKKGKVGATEPAIAEIADVERQGSVVDTDPTLSQKWENPQYWFPDRQPEHTGNTPPPTQRDPETPEKEVPDKVEMDPAMKVELDVLEARYKKRADSVIDLKYRKGLECKDPAKLRAIEMWANKSIEDLKTDYEACKAEIIARFDQRPDVEAEQFDEKDFLSTLTAELESLSVQDTPKSSKAPSPKASNLWVLLMGIHYLNHNPQFFQLSTS